MICGFLCKIEHDFIAVTQGCHLRMTIGGKSESAVVNRSRGRSLRRRMEKPNTELCSVLIESAVLFVRLSVDQVELQLICLGIPYIFS